MAYKVGDKVRILDAKKIMFGKKYWEDGDVTKVKRVLDDGRPCLSRNTAKLGDRGLALWSTELQYIEKVEESDAKMTQFKVGDKVRINGLSRFGKDYIGKVGEVRNANVDCDGDIHVKVDGYTICILPSKVELVSLKPTKNQRITTLEQKVEAMQAEMAALKAVQKPKSILSGEGTLIFDSKPIAKVSGISYKTMTPNEQASANEKRKAIIDEAKAFVEDVTKRMSQYGHGNKLGEHGEITTNVRGYVTKVEFVVNAEKRTVVAIVRNLYGDYIREKAIAKCNPSDVFNADIGKAIALGRALGLDVSKFEKAVQPTEFAVGQIALCGRGKPYTITEVREDRGMTKPGTFHWKRELRSGVVKITNDTEAKY